MLPQVLVAGTAGGGRVEGAFVLVGLAWAAGGFGGGAAAAAVWAYVREALAAADAMLRAVEVTCWAWSALALTLRIVAWMSSSFLAIANWIRRSGEELVTGGMVPTLEPASQPSMLETKDDRAETVSARLKAVEASDASC